MEAKTSLKQSGNLIGAIGWLYENADRSTKDLNEESNAGAGDAADVSLKKSANLTGAID